MQKKTVIIISSVCGFVAVSLPLFFAYVIFSPAARTLVVRTAAERLSGATLAETNMLPWALGFDAPRTYLVLFLNNTELRPGGGFIGAYAVVRVYQGVPEIVKVEGTEILDNYAATAFLTPPLPLQKYLKITKWQFRDSNWSPDFSLSASTSLGLYKLERGTEAAKIDGVIGFTPSVIEELLRIVGPIMLNGQEFTSDNFTEKLEYEVEYGYVNRGVSFKDRKQTMGELARTLLPRLLAGGLKHWSSYMALLPRLLAEKQLVLFASGGDAAALLFANGWDGRMKATRGDYLLWADANLGALKTDAAITRSLSYEIAPVGDTYVATATMHFVHGGKFDWRTSRYRDYARVFVPLGSKLIGAVGAMAGDRDPTPGHIDEGVEGGRQWFGAFFSVEPGRSHTLSFHYVLPPSMAEHILRGPNYTLDVQKQIGTVAPQLTVDLNFGKKLVATDPKVSGTEGKSVFHYQTDLRTDRTFEITF